MPLSLLQIHILKKHVITIHLVFELDTRWIIGSSLNKLLCKNDHFHLTKYSCEKRITLCQQAQFKFNKNLQKSRGSTIWYSYKLAISSLNEEEFPPLSVYSPLNLFTDTANSSVCVQKSPPKKTVFPPLDNLIFINL